MTCWWHWRKVKGSPFPLSSWFSVENLTALTPDLLKYYTLNLGLANTWFLRQMSTPILRHKKSMVSDIDILADCEDEMLVTKIHDGGRISYILTNISPNINALNSKHFNWHTELPPFFIFLPICLNNINACYQLDSFLWVFLPYHPDSPGLWMDRSLITAITF